MRTLLSTLVIFTLAVGVSAAAEVSVAKELDGSFTATTDNYTARVGADGNLHSLVSGGSEFLLDGYRGVVGGSYLTITEGNPWQAEAYRFDQIEQTAPDAVTASADKHRLTYKFLPDGIEFG